jgi:protein-S-isoprenylcysteine O-methyltransferase Ste14
MAQILLISFVSLAIILRMLIQYHYTGDHGLRLAKPGSPYIEVIPGSVFVLSFVISGVLISLNYFGLFPVENTWPALVDFSIGLLGFTGIAITLVAQMQMGRSWRIGVDQKERTDLKVGGLYSKSRNPIYLGILIYWLAICICFPHPAMWLCAIVCWVSIEVIVRKIEEPYLRKVHGDAFEDYYRGSNRYLIW